LIISDRYRSQDKEDLMSDVERSNILILGGGKAGEGMSVAQMAMQTGMPYTAQRDEIFVHPTMAAGLPLLFAKVEPRRVAQTSCTQQH
jgi:probable pyridine nucleotide-disulfide oxidoreductase